MDNTKEFIKLHNIGLKYEDFTEDQINKIEKTIEYKIFIMNKTLSYMLKGLRNTFFKR